MPSTRVAVKVLKEEKTKTEQIWTLQFRNGSGQLAFFLNPQLIRGGEEVLPSFWSDNYFSLSAGEVRTVTVSCPLAGKTGTKTSLRLEGWNVAEQEQELSAAVAAR